MKSTTMVVNPDGEWVASVVPESSAALGLPEPADDSFADAIEKLGFIKLQTVENVIVEIELHPSKVSLPALLAV